MSWLKSTLLATALTALGATFESAAQTLPAAGPAGLMPQLHVFAIAGFQNRAPGQGVTGVITLAPGAEEYSAVRLLSDVSGPCSNQLQMPADRFGTQTDASAEWRVEAALVASDGEQATVDIRWRRRVPRPGRILEGDLVQERRLVLRDRGRGILDLVRRAGDAPGVCDSFAIGLELRFQSAQDAADAGLGYDLWLIDRAAPGQAIGRVRTQARQGADATYAFAPQTLTASSGEVNVHVSGTVTGRARQDGSIDLTFDTSQAIGGAAGNRSGGGRKRLLVRAGETIEFAMPKPLQAQLPRDLEHHDYALRVTVERLW
jgi:hypothetical protein